MEGPASSGVRVMDAAESEHGLIKALAKNLILCEIGAHGSTGKS